MPDRSPEKNCSSYVSPYLINGRHNSCQPLLHITRMLSMTTHNYIYIIIRLYDVNCPSISPPSIVILSIILTGVNVVLISSQSVNSKHCLKVCLCPWVWVWWGDACVCVCGMDALRRNCSYRESQFKKSFCLQIIIVFTNLTPLSFVLFHFYTC